MFMKMTNISLVKKGVTQAGSSLIEVMVALFVLAIGLLGILSMQTKSVQYTQSAYYYSQAMYLANEMVESMRSNTEQIDNYRVALGATLTAPSGECSGETPVCTASQLKDLDIYNWRQNVSNSLASGKGAIATLGDVISITIEFDDSRSGVGEGPELAQYVLVTEIN